MARKKRRLEPVPEDDIYDEMWRLVFQHRLDVLVAEVAAGKRTRIDRAEITRRPWLDLSILSGRYH
jgi:hypothetical protein